MSQRAYEQISGLIDNLVYVYFFDQMEAANWEYLTQKIAETQNLMKTLASAKLQHIEGKAATLAFAE